VKKILLVLVVALFACTNLYAETIILKSGKQIEAKIIEKGSEWIKVDTAGVQLTYFLDEIDTIDGKIAVSGPVSQAALKSAQEAVNAAALVKEEASKIEVAQNKVPLAAGKTDSSEAKQLAMLIMIIIIIIFGYIFPSICLQFIARKTNKTPTWLAWIPVGNLFLMCKIASVNYLWLLVLLLSLIPMVGIIINLVFGGFIWYRIAEARQKPGWVGVLAIVPIVGLFVFGYLAFSE